MVEQEVRVQKLIPMNVDYVKKIYAFWAPFYDWTFGFAVDSGRRQVVDYINGKFGRVLEVGLGTGLSLPRYRRHLKITGIDISPGMLDKARRCVTENRYEHVEAILEMDASALDFPSGSFDIVVAMYVMTVVDDPEKVMKELARVCAPGGEVILVNHFSHDQGARSWVEKCFAPIAAKIGWRSTFPKETVLCDKGLQLVEERVLKPCSLFTMLRFIRKDDTKGDEDTTDSGMKNTDSAVV